RADAADVAEQEAEAAVGDLEQVVEVAPHQVSPPRAAGAAGPVTGGGVEARNRREQRWEQALRQGARHPAPLGEEGAVLERSAELRAQPGDQPLVAGVEGVRPTVAEVHRTEDCAAPA